MIAGTHRTMNGITRAMLTRYRDEHYAPSRAVLAVAGRIDGDLTRMLESTFGRVRAPRRNAPAFRRAAFRPGRTRVALKFKETEQVLVSLGFPGFPYGHRKLPALVLLATILGGGMSSRLFTEVRERRGLAYSVSADVEVFQDTGYLAVFAGLSKAKLKEGIATILGELATMAKSGPTAEELRRAKDYLRGKMILKLEASSALADFYARQELLTRRTETPEEKLAKIDAVTREDVRALAAGAFRATALVASVIGPYKDSAPFMRLLKA
jgi:predicted Zn-dependent peptidase